MPCLDDQGLYACTFISLFLLLLMFSDYFLFSCIVSIKCIISTSYDLVLHFVRIYQVSDDGNW